jgi:predicted O-methyltransferase YrrM
MDVGQTTAALEPAYNFAAGDVAGQDRRSVPWMRARFLHRLFGRSRIFRALSLGMACRLELALLGGHKCAATVRLIREIREERESLISSNEAFLLHSLAASQSKLDGVMAEVGVYQGCSAKLISLASRGIPLHLFDTFDGLPEPRPAEQALLQKGQYCGSLHAVRVYLAGQHNIVLHPGEFPATTLGSEDLRFSFVHLDVDLEASTLACLDFFYPRMVPGGIIVTHDYSWLAGVRAACDKFLANRPEMMIEMPTSQAILVKL